MGTSDTGPARVPVARTLLRAVVALALAVAVLLTGWLALARAGVLQRGYGAAEERALLARWRAVLAEVAPGEVPELTLLLDGARARIAAPDADGGALRGVVDRGLALVARGGIPDGLAGLAVAVEALERARELGLDAAELAAGRRPEASELTRLLVVDALRAARRADDAAGSLQDAGEVGADEERARADAATFLTLVMRDVALERVDALRAAGDDLDALRALEVADPPGRAALFVGSVLRLRSVWKRYARTLLAPHGARAVDAWRELVDRWDRALAAA